MNLKKLKEQLGLKVAAGDAGLDREITGGYTGDLLSDVIANSRKGDVWITLQTHPNIVAVAGLRELGAIILVNNRVPDEETVKVAEKEGIPILTTGKNAFEISGLVHGTLLAGS